MNLGGDRFYSICLCNLLACHVWNVQVSSPVCADVGAYTNVIVMGLPDDAMIASACYDNCLTHFDKF